MRSGWVEGWVTDEKGGPGKWGGSGPPDPPSGHAYDAAYNISTEVMVDTVSVRFHNVNARTIFVEIFYGPDNPGN